MNYLIYSNSYRLRDEEISKIIKDSQNVNKYDLNFDDIDNILEEASYFSLFDETKYLIITNSDIFTNVKVKYNDTKLIEYLNNPNPNTTIIFVTNNKIDEKKKITSLFKEKYKIINLKNPTIKEIYTKIDNLFKKDKYKIDSRSIYYIINSSLNNYDLAYNNALKIKMYFQDNLNIDYDTVTKLTSVNAEDNNFKFVEYVINKDYKNAYKCLNDLILNKVDPLNLINLLFREYKIMLQVKSLEKRKLPRYEICKKLKLQDWQLDKFLKNNYNYREKDLEDYLKQLLEFDYQIKQSKIDKQLALELFILSL